MTITVEDGSIVTGANSYVSETDMIAYAAARGVTIEVAEAEQFLIVCMDYLETRLYQGSQVSFGTQPLSWPRNGVYIEDNLLDNDAIPDRLVNALNQLCIELKSGYDALVTITKDDQVKRKSFAVFAKEYFDNASSQPIFQKVNAWLNPLLESGGGGIQFQIERTYQ